MKASSFRALFLSAFFLFTGFSDILFSHERGSSAPFISGDTFRTFADHVFDETTLKLDPAKVKKGDVIFVKTDWEYLEKFFTSYHPEIAAPYILMTHNSDHGIPGPFASYLDDPKLLAWFGQNVEGESHLKLYNLPIGIANKCWVHGNPDVFSTLLSLAQNEDRPFLCYLNFEPSTYLKERPYVKALFCEKDWCIVSPSVKELSGYLKELSQSKFVLSPRGNGIDCHRTWEALLMDSIPIVLSSTLDPLYEDLPVLIVDDWEIITQSYLEAQYESFKLKTYNLEKIFIHYWITKIRLDGKHGSPF